MKIERDLKIDENVHHPNTKNIRLAFWKIFFSTIDTKNTDSYNGGTDGKVLVQSALWLGPSSSQDVDPFSDLRTETVKVIKIIAW